jgi:flagellar protein FlgJ
MQITAQQQVYTDFEGLAALRAKAQQDQDAALDEVARQFESLFLQMMLKSMRSASLGSGMLDSQQSLFYRDMFDQQIAVDMTRRDGIGLANVLKQQLGDGIAPAYRDLAPEDYVGMPIARAIMNQAADDAVAPALARPKGKALSGKPQDFIDTLWPLAEQAAAELGIAPEALLSQAALETGWGRHVIQDRSGGNSHNLFGIKADERWQGGAVPVGTLEYIDGVAVKTKANFRAYDSYAESFEDYVRFVRDNPRYREAIERTDDPSAYFSALQEAGYATDPAYARKILDILDSEPMQRASGTQGREI